MALLDVTEVLLDPDFMDGGLVCFRGVQTVGDDGLAVNAETQHPFYGVITSSDGDILARLPDGERIIGSILIHTKFRLNDGSATETADKVTWRGRSYTVTNVNDYSHFGQGFVAAECDLIPLSG